MPDKTDFKPTINPEFSTAQEMFARILQERIQAGALEQAITKQVDTLIAETSKEVFRSYGKLGEEIKKQLTNAIMPSLEKLDDFPVYHDFVTNRLKLAAQEFYDSRLKEVLDKELEQVFSEVPEKLTLSYIIDQILESVRSEKQEYGEGEISLHIDKTRYGSVHVSIDKESDVSEYSCGYRLHLSENNESNDYSILSIKIDDKDHDYKLCAGRLYNIDKILFNVYAMKGHVIIDEGIDPDNYTTSWCEWD